MAFKHVTVGNAIDWRQWKLDQSVRSIRMQVDKDNDLYALPVVLVDPTGENVSTMNTHTNDFLQQLNFEEVNLGVHEQAPFNFVYDWTLYAFEIAVSRATQPVAGFVHFFLRDDYAAAPETFWDGYLWVPNNPTGDGARIHIQLPFPHRNLGVTRGTIPSNCEFACGANLTLPVEVNLWGKAVLA